MAQVRRRSIIFPNSGINEEIVEKAETELESIPVEVEKYLTKVENECTEWKEICKKMKENKDKSPFLEPSKFDFKSHLTQEELEYLKEIEDFGKEDISKSKKVLKDLEMVERLTKRQSKTVECLFQSYRQVIDMAQTELIMKKLDNHCPNFDSLNTQESEIQDDESFLCIENL